MEKEVPVEEEKPARDSAEDKEQKDAAAEAAEGETVEVEEGGREGTAVAAAAPARLPGR